jgi:hypothetical protein
MWCSLWYPRQRLFFLPGCCIYILRYTLGWKFRFGTQKGQCERPLVGQRRIWESGTLQFFLSSDCLDRERALELCTGLRSPDGALGATGRRLPRWTPIPPVAPRPRPAYRDSTIVVQESRYPYSAREPSRAQNQISLDTSCLEHAGVFWVEAARYPGCRPRRVDPKESMSNRLSV